MQAEPRKTGAQIPAQRDWWVGLAYLAVAVAVLSGLWRDPDGRYLQRSGQDQPLWEWFFAFTAHAVTNFDNPLFTTLQNFPVGVNLMANTVMFGLGIPLAPITLTFGAATTFAVALTLGLASTAFAWYWLYSRELVESRAAAILGGLFCGFAPAMISHANAHPNFVFLPVLPLIAWRVIELTRRQPRLRDGVLLGCLFAFQIVLGEEPLLIFVLAFTVFGLAFYRMRIPLVVVRPLAISAAVCLLLTAPLLWWQFLGPQSYRSIDHLPGHNDALAFLQFPTQSITGFLNVGPDVSINPTEDNAYWGFPLVLLIASAIWWLRRERVVQACAVVIVGFTVLSLGSTLDIGGKPVFSYLPWRLVEVVPVVHNVLESRWAIAAIPAIGALIALVIERGSTRWLVAVVVALGLLAPPPVPTQPVRPTPVFFTSGSVDRFVDDGSVLLVPPPRPQDAQGLLWQADSDFSFPLARGYFVAPRGSDGKGRYGPEPRPTARLLVKAQRTGDVPPIGERERRQLRADLDRWQVDVIVLPNTHNVLTLLKTVTQLVGAPPQIVDDVWVWPVR